MTATGSLVERARKIAPAIAERASQVEEMRHVHEDSMQEMVDAGLTRALQPAKYGGEEASPAEWYAAVEEISKACTSTGWILGVLGVHTWEMAHMSAQLNDELFGADPTTLISSSYNVQGNRAERVPGGYRLSGRWKSSSGVHHSSWVVLGALVDGEESPLHLVVPISEVEVVDDWYVLGLVGTGSRTVVLDDVFVPEHRTADRELIRAQFGPGLKEHTAPLFQVKQAYLYTISSAPVLGAGWRFYEEFKSAYSVSTTVSRQLAGDRLMTARVAAARSALTSAETVCQARLTEGYRAACEGRDQTDLEYAQSMYDIARNAQSVIEMASSLFPTLRPNSVYRSNIMQRLYRDIIVARQHNTANIDELAEPLAGADLGFSGSHHLFLTPEKKEAARRRAEKLGYL